MNEPREKQTATEQNSASPPCSAAGCDRDVLSYPDPPGKAYCPEHCPDHDYYYEPGEGWMCDNCGAPPPIDSHIYDDPDDFV